MAEFLTVGAISLSARWVLSPTLPTGTRYIRLSGQGTGDSYAVAFFAVPDGGIISPRKAIDLRDPLILPVPDIPGDLKVGVRVRYRYKRVPIAVKTLAIRVDALLED